jgi:hypothetical protein
MFVKDHAASNCKVCDSQRTRVSEETKMRREMERQRMRERERERRREG